MSTDNKKSYGSTLVLVVLGVLAVYGGSRWLTLLLPAAILVCYATARSTFGRGRN